MEMPYMFGVAVQTVREHLRPCVLLLVRDLLHTDFAATTLRCLLFTLQTLMLQVHASGDGPIHSQPVSTVQS